MLTVYMLYVSALQTKLPLEDIKVCVETEKQSRHGNSGL